MKRLTLLALILRRPFELHTSFASPTQLQLNFNYHNIGQPNLMSDALESFSVTRKGASRAGPSTRTRTARTPEVQPDPDAQPIRQIAPVPSGSTLEPITSSSTLEPDNTASVEKGKAPETAGKGPPGTVGLEPNDEWKHKAALVDLVSAYGRGDLSKGQAVLKGSAAIEALAGTTDRSRDLLLEGFLSGLESNHQSGTHRGRRLSDVFETTSRDGRGGSERDEEEENFEWRREETQAEHIRSNKRVREEDFPWFEETQHFNRTQLNDSSRKTRIILERARSDIPTVQSWVQLARGGPGNFPPSEWTNILRGRPVNLNNVYGNMHVSHPVQENVGNLGGISIRVAQAEPAKRIRSAIEWTASWQRAAQATSVVFPHRNDELRQYGEYISSLFTATGAEYHSRIFLYDEAIRGLVGGGKTILLTDTQAFHHFYTAIMLPGGVESNRFSKRRATGPNSEICRRFNKS